MNNQYQNKLLQVYQQHHCLLALHLTLGIVASEGPEDARVSTLTYISEFCSAISAMQA
jgi:hypothetical protein